MVGGLDGEDGVDVQSAVEAELRPDPDLAPIHHRNMEETTVQEVLSSIVAVILIPVQVSNNLRKVIIQIILMIACHKPEAS